MAIGTTATNADRCSYDVFGGVRDSQFVSTANGALNLLPETLRGFTDHEHLDAG